MIAMQYVNPFPGLLRWGTAAGGRPSPSSTSEWSFSEEDVQEHAAILIDRRPKPKEKYPAKLHARSVAQHLRKTDGLIYLPGLPEYTHEDSDQPAQFRQRRYFYYLSGINFPGCFLTYHIRQDLLFAWIQHPTTGSSVIYNGPSVSRKDIYENYNVDGVSYISGLNDYLSHFADCEEGKIYVLHAHQLPEAINMTAALSNGPRDTIALSFDATSLQPAMDAARVIKSPYEIEMLRKANYITAKAHVNVLRSIKHLINEAEIEAIFEATCTSAQAKNQAYGVIAGSGTNASILHYVANNQPLAGRQLVCLDAGCEWACYASDVTRTFPISGKFSKEGKEIYDLVARMQEECIEMIKPGANYRDIHMHAHRVATKGLMKLGLLKGNFAELYDVGASKIFFPHGLGHYLGLECHDVGNGGALLLGSSSPNQEPAVHYQRSIGHIEWMNNTAASVLHPNMVVTVEPGIYFSRYAIEDVYLNDDRYAKYINEDILYKYYPVGGVRIEDDILVTKDGYENLTTAPKGEEALRIINEDTEMEAARKEVWVR